MSKKQFLITSLVIPTLVSRMIFFGVPSAVGAEIQWERGAVPAGGAKGFTELRNGDLLAARTVGAEPGAKVICARSQDGGRTWHDLSVIVRDETPGVDLGDGDMLELRDGRVLYSYRQNLFSRANAKHPQYRIRLAVSRDGGIHWSDGSTVKGVQAGEGEIRGLWSSYLRQAEDGSVQCYYDDEDAAWCAGFRGHQWLIMATWDDRAGKWRSPVVVSRAREPQRLSRDGMASVVELSGGGLLCAFESVAADPPHQNVIRLVRSADGGCTWSWRTGGRELLYSPVRHGYSAVAPWLSRLRDGRLICVFATDEDRDRPDKPGARVRAMNRDIKYVISKDEGCTWTSDAAPVYVDTHKAYMPQIVQLNHSRHAGAVLCLFSDAKRGFLGMRGKLREDAAREHRQGVGSGLRLHLCSKPAGALQEEPVGILVVTFCILNEITGKEMAPAGEEFRVPADLPLYH